MGDGGNGSSECYMHRRRVRGAAIFVVQEGPCTHARSPPVAVAARTEVEDEGDELQHWVWQCCRCMVRRVQHLHVKELAGVLVVGHRIWQCRCLLCQNARSACAAVMMGGGAGSARGVAGVNLCVAHSVHRCLALAEGVPSRAAGW